MTQTVLLGDLVNLKRGYDLPATQRRTGSYPIVSSSGVTDYHVEAKVKGPGVITGRYGTLGKTFYVSGDYWPLNTTLYVEDFKGNNPKYISYLLGSLKLGDENIAGAVPGVNRNFLHKMKVPFTERPRQDKIVEIIDAIDEKIELNRRMNETLERMGQALFKKYFIANPEAKKWEEKSLDDIANFINGLAMQKYPKVDGEPALPVIKIREMSSGITTNTDIANANIPKQYVVHNGDLLFSWSGTLLVKFWSEGDGALNQHLFKVTSNKYPEWLYYHWTKYHLNDFIQTAKSKATTMGHIQRKHLNSAKVLVPPRQTLGELTEGFQPLIDQQKNSSEEAQALTTLRDTLLPHLISGKNQA